MKCPRCETEVQNGTCPQCGLAMSREFGESSGGQVSQAPLQFSVSSKTTRPSVAVDWRSELRRKLQKYARKKGEKLPGRSAASPIEKRRRKAPSSDAGKTDAPLKQDRPTPPEPAPKETQQTTSDGRERGLERPLFKYRLEDMEKEPRRKIVTFDKTKPQRDPLDKPLIRKPVKTHAAAKTGGPEQKSLTLDVVASSTAAPPPTAVPSEPEGKSPTPEVSGEILFSRVLGAIIDVMIAAAAGMLLSFIGAWLLDSAFPSSQALMVAGGAGVLFLFIDSVFFLYTLGATPGMSATDLKLVEEDGREVSLRTAMVRTLLSFLVTATVVGLVWAIFDPQRRCWHDRLSGTMVVPGKTPTA